MKNILERMNEYNSFSSWAIWESKRENHKFEKATDLITDIDFKKYEGNLQENNIVVLGMNPGGTPNISEAKTLSRKGQNKDRPWNNFHNQKSNDHYLAQALSNTKVYGSYMTDLFPIIGSESKDVRLFVDSEENQRIVKRFILEFDEEMELLLPNEPNIKLLCIGKDTARWAKKYLTDEFPSKKNYEILRIPHYSFNATRHVKNAAKKILEGADKLSQADQYSLVVKHELKKSNF